jgi:hypothetical protein
MSILKLSERAALKMLRKGAFAEHHAVDQLVKQKLVRQNPLELTDAGRIVCDSMAEIEKLGIDEDSSAQGEY